MSLVKRPAPALALMSMLFLVTTAELAAAEFAAPVDVDEVRLSATDETVAVMGRVVALQAGPVAARTTAAVNTVHVNVGDAVSQGDLLVSLHNQRQRSVLALARADLKQWQAKLKTAQLEREQSARDLQRLESLRNSSAFNVSLFEQRQTADAAASAKIAEFEASLSYAKIQIKRAQQDLDWTLVKAPYDAVVSERFVEQGQWVALGAAVVNLISTSALEVEVDIPAQYLQRLQQGNKLQAMVNGSPLELALRAVLPAEKAMSRTRLARFSLALSNSESPQLNVNQAVTVAVPLSRADAMTVHKDAVMRNGGMSTVYKVVDGVAKMTAVTLGAAAGARLEVISGLSEGDIVVTRGNERLQPGQKVSARPQP